MPDVFRWLSSDPSVLPVDQETIDANNFLDLLFRDSPANPPTGKFFRIGSNGRGEWADTIAAINYDTTTITGNYTLGGSDRWLQIASSAITIKRLLIRHTTPSTAVTITIPNTLPVGPYLLAVARDQTGTVTLSLASGVTVNGQTSAITLDGPGATVSLDCLSNPGTAPVIEARGEISTGERLTGVTELEEVRGAYMTLKTITANRTLDATDRGCELRCTAAVTITVPSGYRGIVHVRNVSGGTVTISLPGGGTKTITNNQKKVIDANGTDVGVSADVYA